MQWPQRWRDIKDYFTNINHRHLLTKRNGHYLYINIFEKIKNKHYFMMKYAGTYQIFST